MDGLQCTIPRFLLEIVNSARRLVDCLFTVNLSQPSLIVAYGRASCTNLSSDHLAASDTYYNMATRTLPSSICWRHEPFTSKLIIFCCLYLVYLPCLALFLKVHVHVCLVSGAGVQGILFFKQFIVVLNQALKNDYQ